MLTLEVLTQTFTICKLNPDSIIPDWIWDCSLYSITKTTEELSLICEQDKVIAQNNMIQEKNWKCLKVMGPLDFSLTGILSSIAQPLAKNQISIFSMSTYNTDYIFIKESVLDKARLVLQDYDFTIV